MTPLPPSIYLPRKNALISCGGLAQLLGISENFAAEILDTLSNERTEGLDPILPLYLTERTGERVRLEGSQNPFERRALRLTKSQAAACEAAFAQLGINAANPLKRKLVEAFYPINASYETYETGDVQENPGLKALEVCVASLAKAQRINADVPHMKAPVVEFEYEGTNDKALGPRTRRAVPTHIRYAQDQWMVDCYDLDARATRTYIAANIKGPQVTNTTAEAPTTEIEHPGEGTVKLTCDKEVMQQVLSWDNAQLVGISDNKAEILIPYYRGEWLPRHVLSLGKAVHYDNPRLKREVREIAAASLRRAKNLKIC